MPKTYTVREVAEILGYSTNSIYTFIKEKRIKAVRVGRGRFRIPQTELDRLLLSKSGNPSPAMPSKGAEPSITRVAQDVTSALAWIRQQRDGVAEPPGHSLVSAVTGVDTAHIHVPNFYDWFLGLCSIIIGVSLMLFDKTLESAVASRLLLFKPAIQAVFVAGGLGLLLTDIVGKKARLWHFIFHGLSILGFIGLAAGLATIGDIEGGLFYGSIGVIPGIGSLWGLGGVASFTLVLFLIVAIIGPAALLFFPHDPHVAWAFRGMPEHFYLVWVFLGVAGGAGLVVAYKKSRRAYFFLVALVAAVFIGQSLWFASENFWPRAFFLLIIGVTCLLTKVWHTLSLTHQSERRAVFGLYGIILLLFLLAVGAVGVFQVNMREYARDALIQKQAFAREFTQGVLEQTKITLESAAANYEIKEAIEKEDSARLTGFARGYFESNPYFYRVIFTTPAGDILAYYPLSDAFTVTNIAFRDYFIQAVTSKTTILSDVFEAATLSKSKRVAYAVPILGKEKRVVGVVVGGISLERLGTKLQEIANEKAGEYFVVVDHAGNRIIHPDKNLIGQPIEKSHPLSAGVSAPAVAQAYTYRDRLALMAYGPVSQLGWTMAIHAPVAGILRSSAVASIVIFMVVGISLVLITGFVQIRRAGEAKVPVPEEPGRRAPATHLSKRRGFWDTS